MMLINQDVIKTLHPGLRAIPAELIENYMPELRGAIRGFPEYESLEGYRADIKVHMLMPGQFPCIPHWHLDFVPRGEDLKQDISKVQKGADMWLWLSGTPLTEFKDGRTVRPQEWVRFSQLCLHRGVQSEEHCWRVFIRLTHESIAPASNDPNTWWRRHTQVYLDSKEFVW